MTPLHFAVCARDPATQARRGVLRLGRATVETPAFMPVATHGFLRAVPPEALEAADVRLLLANTLHLWLRPGLEPIRALGGLHGFMSWRRALLTDSGGFQATSLLGHRELTEEGIRFRSPYDGRLFFLTPERAMELQAELGSDIAMVLDECIPWPHTPGELAAGVRRTLRWAERSLRRKAPGQALFAITQGGVNLGLRSHAARVLRELPFDGYAIGGLGLGEGRAAMHRVVRAHTPELPADRPRYLMGVGPPQDLVAAVAAGVDLFDCVIPTRHGRNGGVFTWAGPLQIRNAALRTDPRPLDPTCPCPVCRRLSRAYLHHVFKSGDHLGGYFLSLHNLHFFQQLMEAVREAITEGTLPALQRRIQKAYGPAAGESTPTAPTPSGESPPGRAAPSGPAAAAPDP